MPTKRQKKGGNEDKQAHKGGVGRSETITGKKTKAAQVE